MNAANFFNQSVILENERASLTPLVESDFEKLETIAYHPAIWKVGMSNLKTPADLNAYIQTALKEKEYRLSYPFLIYDKQNNGVAGSTRFGNISFENKRLEIGWTWLHPDFHGTGLNKAIKFLLLQFAFETLQFNRVEIKTDVINQQSRKAILKLAPKKKGFSASIKLLRKAGFGTAYFTASSMMNGLLLNLLFLRIYKVQFLKIIVNGYNTTTYEILQLFIDRTGIFNIIIL